MKRIFLFAALLCTLSAFGKGKDRTPATVIITAGQSNTNGRVPNDQLPRYIQENKYKHGLWCHGSAQDKITGNFEPFWPRTTHSSGPDRWAYDAVTYYWLEQALQKDFYVVKWSLGGTAIDTGCSSSGGNYWSADPEWLAANHSTATGGKSLLLSFTESISAAIDSTLSRLPGGYDVKAFLWHQGESDHRCGKNYYKNLKAVVEYVRHFLVVKTGDKKYRKLPFICGTVARSNRQYNREVEEALYQLAKEDKNFYVIDMSDAELQRDQLHFTAEAAEYLGVQMYNQLVELGVAGRKARKLKLPLK